MSVLFSVNKDIINNSNNNIIVMIIKIILKDVNIENIYYFNSQITHSSGENLQNI